MIGEIFANRYEIQQNLGKKAGRRTLLARNLETQEPAIIKLLTFGGDFEWDDLKLFEREAETLKSLSHPSIPRYLDYFEVNSPTIKGFALVQTYIPARTLEQYIQTGRTFTEAEVKKIAKALLEMLIYLHGLHPPVIHRDIKPSNILLGDRSGNSIGQVYLVDFGSVQTVLATEGATRTVVGTYGYMPQEQFGGRTVAASDLYSLGATLIYLVTGTQPADLPQKDFRIQFEQVANISPSFSHWLKWMTEPSLEKRLSSANEALQALNKPKVQSTDTLTVIKPVDSKIKLTKNRDSLEIIIPPIGFHLSTMPTGLAIIFINLFFLLFLITSFQQPFAGSLFYFYLFLLLFGISLALLYNFLFGLFGSIRLSLNQQKISLTREIFGVKFNFPQPAQRQDICMLQRIRKYVQKDFARTSYQVKAQIIIWAGKRRKYEIGGNDELITEPEIDWLAHELSDWLGIPIRKE
ncbi:serine/threonine protein kinase [Cylindrospermum sp. FACHB-282]|uniref:serine/threonine protein kinase n=1 Tax=Cylindrospermum sp. FACHB-282 TaxID=2692794 RepID=UPI001683F8B2|nr:serine/threonine-protein kinase [Cylindrospermum sp. FACHB-282]MBD2384558.1 serine/threonine protein kinase [Cylindrospermum sp. FACHB-282]